MNNKSPLFLQIIAYWSKRDLREGVNLLNGQKFAPLRYKKSMQRVFGHDIGRAIVEVFVKKGDRIALCDENSDFINGQCITVDGSITKKMIFPEE